MNITVEHQVKLLRDGGYQLSPDQAAILRRYASIKQNRYDNGEMFELEEDFEVVERRFASLDELAEDTVKLAAEYVEKFGGHTP